MEGILIVIDYVVRPGAEGRRLACLASRTGNCFAYRMLHTRVPKTMRYEHLVISFLVFVVIGGSQIKRKFHKKFPKIAFFFSS